MTQASKPEALITADASLRGCLPRSFRFAAATASYQIEGAWEADGKGPNIWDDFLHRRADKDDGDTAADSYVQWREDIRLLKSYGVDMYRFSVAWSRIRPTGAAGEAVNEAGIKYYSDLVDALVAEGITPCITLFHWDLPLALDASYRGFETPGRIVPDFVAYARVLFERLGDRVAYWITINEPLIYSLLNSVEVHADDWTGDKWAATTRSLLLCHAHTVDMYRREFAPSQGGHIAITLNMDWTVPIDASTEARAAAEEYIDHCLGMYADPIYLGRFPQSCLDRFGATSLSFTPAEWALIKGSNDFFGLNHYSTSYAVHRKRWDQCTTLERAFGCVVTADMRDGVLIGEKGENGHPTAVPWGFRLLLRHIRDRYTGPSGQTIYVTENGWATKGEEHRSIPDACRDEERQTYFAGYIKELAEAVRDDGVEVGAYTAWSLLDNLEWTAGYAPRFGITVVDRADGCKRYPKDSAFMLGRVFKHLRK